MKSLAFTILVFAYAGTLCGQTPKGYDCERRGDIYRDADYRRPLHALKQVVAEKARGNRNTFYISPVCYLSNGYSIAHVYWPEGRALILWEPRSKGDEPSQRRHELVWSRRFWRLDKDVVPTVNEVAGSSFLLTRALARRDIRDCVRNGRKFVLYKRSRLR
jgi:hypothetical protein